MTVLFSNERLLVRRGRQYSNRSLVVAFDSYTDDRRLERIAFGERFAERHKIDLIAVISRDNDWYQYDELRDSLTTIAAIAPSYDRVVSYGASMGGYAAIRFGRWAGAQTAVALSPQYSIDPAVCPWEIRWRIESSKIKFVLEGPDVADGLVQDTFIFFDPHDIDARHAELYRSSCGVRLVALPWSGHPCSGFLADLGLLPDTILDIAHGSFDPLSFERRCRQKRRQSSQYLLTLAGNLKCHHQRTRRQLVEAAARIDPPNPGVHSLCGQILSSLGDFADAERFHRQALWSAPGHPTFLYRYIDHLQTAGRLYEAMTAAARLNFTHPIEAYSQRYSGIYWNRFREAEQIGMTQDEIDVAVSTTPSPPQNATAWRRHLMQVDELSKSTADYYIIGDSYAEFWPSEYLPPNTFNLGNAGDKIQSLLWRLKEIKRRQRLRPRPCIVMIGTNNLAMGDTAESIAVGVRAIKQKINLMTGKQPVLFVAIPPFGEQGLFRNDERLKANALMKASVQTIDFEEKIRALGKAAFLPDNIHLTARAYREMAIDTDLLKHQNLESSRWAYWLAGLFNSLR